ncbi:hypothetical protein VK792_07645 [Mesobacterium sp. TK19101]|uniref:Antifreeze glycopeptide polyprotein n=1 Tax=Mesobacterium hydrothermale TaxID=3111907 RepID=A0ABU6HFA1_9RHOB|nr:hypothetical protein [Mesobacterium sp. TK19101]MEC3861153.1 hypothetical protein [Mesobacterium sp. TK19101]
MWTKPLALSLILLAPPVLAQAPLSAIDWLENHHPEAATATLRPLLLEPPVSASALPPQVEVTALDAPSVSSTGLLPMQVTGLPETLWQASRSADLITQLAALDVTAHPALNDLLITLLLAEAAAPADARQDSAFLQARVRKLLDLGAVDPASALLGRAGPMDPALFPLWFDIALLTDQTTAACRQLRARPHLLRDVASRVFCTARLGDWATAVTVLQSSEALGDISETDATLLAHFLDPELAEAGGLPPPPRLPTPLEYRLYEAIGERLPSGPLPRAFAVTDLSGDAGWKAQLDAAERLARVGTISPNRLLGIYTDRRRAASGGIWDRVEALQHFDTALTAGEPGAVAATLQRVWAQMSSAGLLVPFSQIYGPRLVDIPLTGNAALLAARAALLSPDYELAAAKLPRDLPDRSLLAAIATGQPPEIPPTGAMRAAVIAAFRDPGLPDTYAPLMQGDRLGETILKALSETAEGAQGNPAILTRGLRALRAVGLEDTARRTALHLLLTGGLQ